MGWVYQTNLMDHYLRAVCVLHYTDEFCCGLPALFLPPADLNWVLVRLVLPVIFLIPVSSKPLMRKNVSLYKFCRQLSGLRTLAVDGAYELSRGESKGVSYNTAWAAVKVLCDC